MEDPHSNGLVLKRDKINPSIPLAFFVMNRLLRLKCVAIVTWPLRPLQKLCLCQVFINSKIHKWKCLFSSFASYDRIEKRTGSSDNSDCFVYVYHPGHLTVTQIGQTGQINLLQPCRTKPILCSWLNLTIENQLCITTVKLQTTAYAHIQRKIT